MTPERQIASWINALETRVGDLERYVQRIPPVTTFTPVRRGGGVVDTIGTGGIASGRYQISDGRCHFAILYAFGTSGAAANVGATTFDAPVAFGAGNDAFDVIGSGAGTQAGTRFNFEVLRDGSNNGFQLYAPNQVTAASPGAVTFSDGWRFKGWYWV